MAIRRGKGNADTVKQINYDLETDVGANPSLSVTSYIKRFKQLVRENRTKDLLNKEDNFKVQGFRQRLYNSEQYGNPDIPGDSDEQEPKKARTDHYGPSNAKNETTFKSAQEADAAFCNGCGIIHVFYNSSIYSSKVCKFLYMKHPDYNGEDKPWADSTKGKAYAAKKLKCLSDSSCLNKGEIVPWTKPLRPKTEIRKVLMTATQV